VRIPGLDGFRAIAIAVVIASHLIIFRLHEFLTPRSETYVRFIGTEAVGIFFVLSGFLITTILQRELAASRTISLRSFYFRRTLRIMPAFYAFVLIVAATGFSKAPTTHGTGHWAGTQHGLLSVALYGANYFFPAQWPFGHLWSLSVEEQFYLIWPAALLLCPALWRRYLPLIPLVIVPLIRIAYLRAGLYYDYYQHFECVADALALGCLLALNKDRILAAMASYCSRVKPGHWLALSAVLLPLANPHSGHALSALLIGLPLIQLSFGLAILSAVVNPPRWLIWAPVAELGRISYSLYLWQQPWVENLSVGWLWFPCALLSAWASYRFVERPILAWRDSRGERNRAPDGLSVWPRTHLRPDV
jgi:peptidoglycan/LPS O-acetylase OafA/YrhL